MSFSKPRKKTRRRPVEFKSRKEEIRIMNYLARSIKRAFPNIDDRIAYLKVLQFNLEADEKEMKNEMSQLQK